MYAYVPVAASPPGGSFRERTKPVGVTRSIGGEQIANLVLLAASSSSLRALMPNLRREELKQGMALHRADKPVKRFYFINRGMVSIVKTMADGRTIEVSGTGIEGMTTPEVLFGVNAAILDGIVQIPGSAFVIERSNLTDAVANDPSLRALLQDYLYLSMQRLAQRAACNRLHDLEQRCCRWLLIAQDSARADTFPMTHEFLAMMLGVHRPGASIAMKTLQNAGFVRYNRGNVMIVDRSGLEVSTCECYATGQRESREMFSRRYLDR